MVLIDPIEGLSWLLQSWVHTIWPLPLLVRPGSWTKAVWQSKGWATPSSRKVPSQVDNISTVCNWPSGQQLCPSSLKHLLTLVKDISPWSRSVSPHLSVLMHLCHHLRIMPRNASTSHLVKFFTGSLRAGRNRIWSVVFGRHDIAPPLVTKKVHQEVA